MSAWPEMLRRIDALAANWHVEPLASREDLLGAFARSLDRAALALAVTRLDDVADGDFRDALRRALIGQLAANDIAKAAYYAERFFKSDRQAGRGLVEEIARRWAAMDPQRAAAWLRTLGDAGLVEQNADVIVPALAATDRSAAGALIGEMAPGQAQFDLVDRLVSEWSGVDFDAALDWARRLPSGALQQRVLVRLSYRWEQEDLPGALAFARSLPSGGEQLLDLLVSRLASRLPEQAGAWVRELEPGDQRDRVLGVVLATWAREDPELAAASIDLLPPGAERDRTAVSLISAWAATAPTEAAQWAAARIPPGPTREYAFENIAFRWIQADAVATMAWLQSLPAGREQDVAIHAAAGALVDSEPDLAAQLADAIRNEQMRRQQVGRAMSIWRRRDEPAAMAWLKTTDLSDKL